MSRRVALNAIWNLSGTLAGLLAGLIALPVLLHALGPDRLGIFTLALGLIGFSGLLDLGIGRSLTQSVASALGRGRPRKSIAALVWHVLVLLAGIGVIWSSALWLCVPFIAHHLFHLHGKFAAETVFGLRAVAISMPFALVATGAMGSLEGLQEFRRASIRRALLSIVQFAMCLTVAVWRPDVGFVIAALAASRLVGMCVWLVALHQVLPRIPGDTSQREDVRQLIRFGGWLSVSNVIGPLMVYADRFYLASLFPPASVAYYAVPYDALQRLTSLPITAVGAMFPAFAEQQASPLKSAHLLSASLLTLVALMLPPLMFLMVLAKSILVLWLGADFGAAVLPIFQILVVGTFLSSAAQIPYALLQAHGHSQLTAKLHMVELPIFVFVLVVGVSMWGIIGAAMAWTLRVSLDGALLFGWALRHQRLQRKMLAQGAALIVFSAALLVLPLLVGNPIAVLAASMCVIFLCVALLSFLYSRWKASVSSEMRT